MGKSLNGWTVIEPGDPGLVTRTIPGTKLRLTLNEQCAGLLLYVASRVDKEVRSLEENNAKGGQDEACWNYRQARNANAYSNHASGSAIDLNWRVWPQSGSHHFMSGKEAAAAKKIAEDLKDVIFWGGNWTRFVDEMHWEIAPGVTPKMVADFCKKRGIQDDGTVVPPKPKPAPVAPQPVAPLPKPVVVELRQVRPGLQNIHVRIVKKALIKEGLMRGAFVLSDKYGPRMEKAWKAWEQKLGYGPQANTYPDLGSLRRLGEKHGFEVK